MTAIHVQVCPERLGAAIETTKAPLDAVSATRKDIPARISAREDHRPDMLPDEQQRPSVQ